MELNKDNAELSKNFLLKAKNAYNECLLLKKADSYLGAANRLYYALFYATSAMLAIYGVSAKTHKSIEKLFNMHLIKTGIIDKKYSKLYRKVLRIREESDYEIFYIIDKSEIDSNFILVGEFIDFAEAFI